MKFRHVVRHRKTWALDLSVAGLSPLGFLDACFFSRESVLTVTPFLGRTAASCCHRVTTVGVVVAGGGASWAAEGGILNKENLPNLVETLWRAAVRPLRRHAPEWTSSLPLVAAVLITPKGTESLWAVVGRASSCGPGYPHPKGFFCTIEIFIF